MAKSSDKPIQGNASQKKDGLNTRNDTKNKNQTRKSFFRSWILWSLILLILSILVAPFFYESEFFEQLSDYSSSALLWLNDLIYPNNMERVVPNEKDDSDNPHLSDFSSQKVEYQEQRNRRILREMSCYTLEGYSAAFSDRRLSRMFKDSFFACGTRITDLQTDHNKALVSRCNELTADAETQFPSLRIVLVSENERTLHKNRIISSSTQRIPLSRVNDDYCDCHDGTDELLTGACSMAGLSMPLSSVRWEKYFFSSRMDSFYDEEEEELKYLDSEVAASTPQNKNRQNEKDSAKKHDFKNKVRVKSLEKRYSSRLQHVGGPVLPIACKGDTATLLSPILIGDGVVDCCDGTDEFNDMNFDGATPLDVFDQSSKLAIRPISPETWKGFQMITSENNLSSSKFSSVRSAYSSAVRGDVVTSAQLLYQKGYMGLFSCPVLYKVRERDAFSLYELYKTGHDIQQERVSSGWKKMGKELIQNQTDLALQLENLTFELKRHTPYIQQILRSPDVDPRELGIDTKTLEYISYLDKAYSVIKEGLQHISFMIFHKVLGENYEYYPLYRESFAFPAEKVISSSKSKLPAILKRRQKKLIPLSQWGGEKDNLHLGNLSLTNFYINPFLLLTGSQFCTMKDVWHMLKLYQVAPEIEAELARRKNSNITLAGKQSNSTENNDEPSEDIIKLMIEKNYTLSAFTPNITLGNWHPYFRPRNASMYSVLDPAGDTDIPNFLMVHDFNPVLGGQRTQLPARRNILYNILKIKKPTDSTQKVVQKDEPENEEELLLPDQFNTINAPIPHAYTGGFKCGLQAKSDKDPGFLSRGYVLFACNRVDSILSWAIDGDCKYEVIVGTPSACTSWALNEAKERWESANKFLSNQAT